MWKFIEMFLRDWAVRRLWRLFKRVEIFTRWLLYRRHGEIRHRAFVRQGGRRKRCDGSRTNFTAECFVKKILDFVTGPSILSTRSCPCRDLLDLIFVLYRECVIYAAWILSVMQSESGVKLPLIVFRISANSWLSKESFSAFLEVNSSLAENSSCIWLKRSFSVSILSSTLQGRSVKRL